ncbi:MBG domain-containing protein [Pseudomonas aeruginosa]|nr:MBG domain-containing protein [Pseudomonas aeruginosa]
MTYQVSGLKNGDSAGQVLAGGLGRVGGEAVGQYDILQGGLALTSGNYQLNYQGNLLSILPLPVTPGDLGQLAALSDLRELQKGRDPDTPGMRSTAPPRWKTRSSKTRSCAPTLWVWTSAIRTCCRLPPRARRRTPAPSGWGSSPIVRSGQRPRVGRVARTRATWPTTGAASTSL